MQSDYENRARAISERLRRENASAYVGTRLAGLHYLCGAFMPWRGAVVVTADGACEIIYWAMDSERVRQEGCPFPVTDFYGSDLVKEVKACLDRHGAASGTIGVDLSHPGAAQIAPGMLTAGEYLDLVGALPDARLVNGVRWIDDVMLFKSPDEIAKLRLAAAAADHGFQAGFAAIQEGVTENHVAGIIEAAIRDKGSIWPWSVTGATEVGAGERTAYGKGVTQQATERRIGRDEFVILDIHTMIDLYIADLALPVFFGKTTPEQDRLIACWEDVTQTMLGSLKPGRPVVDCVKDGIAAFERHGQQDFGLPLFGHGLGTDARSRPFINLSSDDVIEPGMVVALGTHLYRPGTGGMRMEYPVLVTENGAEPLAQTPAQLHRL